MLINLSQVFNVELLGDFVYTVNDELNMAGAVIVTFLIVQERIINSHT